MLTNEEAIYVLKNTAWLGSNDDRETTEQAVDMAIEALSAEAKTKCVAQIKVDTEEVARRIKEEYDITDGWIPVSERLPDDGQDVLVTVDDNEFNIKVGSCRYSHGVFHSKLYRLSVLAWMPLPKPYREDGEE